MLQTISSIQRYLSQDFLGGPRLIKLSWLINFQKGGTLPLVLFLMFWFDRFTIEGWVYLAMHGSYGLCWLIKDLYFPDKRWDIKITIGGALMSFVLVLGLYWLFPVIILSPWFHDENTAWSPYYLGICIFLHTIGVTLMMTSDVQKFYTLKYHPGLIREGLFSRTRNPNYLGEIMIYGSYALMAKHWLGWAIIIWVGLGYFALNILMKERSLSRYPDWMEYKKQSGMVLPKLF